MQGVIDGSVISAFRNEVRKAELSGPINYLVDVKINLGVSLLQLANNAWDPVDYSRLYRESEQIFLSTLELYPGHQGATQNLASVRKNIGLRDKPPLIQESSDPSQTAEQGMEDLHSVSATLTKPAHAFQHQRATHLAQTNQFVSDTVLDLTAPASDTASNSASLNTFRQGDRSACPGGVCPSSGGIRVVASLSTIPPRMEVQLRAALDALLPQVRRGVDCESGRELWRFAIVVVCDKSISFRSR